MNNLITKTNSIGAGSLKIGNTILTEANLIALLELL